METTVPKLKRYIDIYVPVTTCTLRCHYCYIFRQNLFGKELPKFKYSPEVVGKALSRERMGGVCLINFCADGSEWLQPEFKAFVSQKLKDANEEYTPAQKRLHTIVRYPLRKKISRGLKNWLRRKPKEEQ